MAEFKETDNRDRSMHGLKVAFGISAVIALAVILYAAGTADYFVEAFEPREVIKEVPVEKIVYVNKTVEVPVDRIVEKPVPVYINHTIIREVPVEKIVEIEKPIIIEKEKIVYVEVPVYLPAPQENQTDTDNSTDGDGDTGVPPDAGTASIVLKAFRLPSEHWGETFAGAGAQMYFAVYDTAGNIAAQGFFDENGTPLSLVANQTYYAYPADCQGCHDSDHDVVFKHWKQEDNSQRPRAFVAGEFGELHAYYEYVQH